MKPDIINFALCLYKLIEAMNQTDYVIVKQKCIEFKLS